MRIWDVPEGTVADAIPLARLAEAISGFHVTADGTLQRLDALAAVRQERNTAARLPADAQTLSARITRWFFEDRANRTISPFSNTKRNKE